MQGNPACGVFISYRREDAGPYARLLQFQFSERISDARVFMDLDSIEAGLDFAEVIRDAVESCVVLVALIGRQWATLTDEEGHRRLPTRTAPNALPGQSPMNMRRGRRWPPSRGQ